MKAKIVIGLQFGDEGKGITTDYLCSFKCAPRRTINIRFSGGQQAGHNVVKGGKSHIFASFGAGTLAGCPTYLTEHCTFYPPNILNEYNVLKELVGAPLLFIHPKAMCTTPYDVAFNRWREKIEGHGSCGIGIGATMKRNLQSPYKFYATDLIYPAVMYQKLEAIKKYYINEIGRITEDIVSILNPAIKEFLAIASIQMADFLQSLESLIVQHAIKLNLRNYDLLQNFDYLVFEGSQGIMLDMEHGIFPNVTYAHTTSKNAIEVCNKIGVGKEDIEIYYVTRCYQTRHGEGWMSNNEKITLVNNENETNVTNEWQKDFKVGEIDYQLLNYAIKCDSYSWGCGKNLVVTCLDQRPGFKFDYSALDYWWKVYESHSPESCNIITKQSGYEHATSTGKV